MRRLIVLMVGVALLVMPAVAVGGSNGSGNGTACVSTTQLRAENEPSGSTSTAFGNAQIKIRNDATLEFTTHIVNHDAETFFAGHVHKAPAGVNGPIVVPLFSGPPTSDEHIALSGETPIAPALAADICADPQGYYVNYHTTANPGGAIRGQLG